MAALTAPRVTPYYGGPQQPPATFTGQDLIDVVQWPVKAGVKIWLGAQVVINAGFAEGAIVATGLIPIGQALQTVDNTGGADGAVRVKVQGGVNQWDNFGGDLVTQAAGGKLCFCRDDHTVSLTNAGGTLSPAGTVVNVDAKGVWVQAYAPPIDTTTAEVPQARLINTTAPLAGGGDLSADRTLSIGTFPNANPLAINNAADTHKTTIQSGAVGSDLTLTTPATSGTMALAAVQTGAPSATGAPAFTGSAVAFTGTPATQAVNVTPAFSGTGCAAAGQVITTTDTQTMTVNQCAGMLFVSDGTPGNCAVILSNTSVAGAVAVLTVAGFAQTAAGAYRIFKGVTPAGTNAACAGTIAAVSTAAHTHTQS